VRSNGVRLTNAPPSRGQKAFKNYWAREQRAGEAVTLSRTKVLGFISGLLVGGFLFSRLFGWDNDAALTGWWWYQGAALLCAIGLARMFREAPLGAAVGMSIAPLATWGLQVATHPGDNNL